MPVNVLSISDKVVPFIYSTSIKNRYDHIDFVLACGDLPYYYQEFIVSMLDVPLFFVRGNHDPEVEYGKAGERCYPHGGIDLHRRVVCHQGILLAGVEGSIRYKPKGRFQYTQNQMWRNVFSLVPRLLFNRLWHGRYLDIFISHAPPWTIHDQPDGVHQGIKAFRWLIRTFKPRYHFHGHVHVYDPRTITETMVGETLVINTYKCRQTTLELDGDQCVRDVTKPRIKLDHRSDCGEEEPPRL
jgi:Icc-related predicted phosphoesterase